MIRAILLSSFVLLSSGAAVAETTPPRCTEILSVPAAPITTPGVYCLTQNMNAGAMTSGNVITINANNVTLDCNDRMIDGLGGGLGTQAKGIVATNRANITVHNCLVRGFKTGIELTGSGNASQDNLITNSTWVGLYISGDGSVARRNRVLDTGGNTAKDDPRGIWTYGDVDILENLVANVTATATSNDTAYGLMVRSNSAGAIGDNHVRNILGDGTGSGTGIYNYENGKISIYRNRLSNPVAKGYGVICHYGDVGPAIASDNHINGFSLSPSPMPFCFDGGHNVAK
ncbi:MAG TPA: hypothetical protein VGD21_06760 [Lysobacter sp.]